MFTHGLCVAFRREEGVGDMVPPPPPATPMEEGVMVVQEVTEAVEAQDVRPVRVPEGVGLLEGDREGLPLGVGERVEGGEEEGEGVVVAPPPPPPSAARGEEVGKEEGVESPVPVPPPPPIPALSSAEEGVASWGGEGETQDVGVVPPPFNPPDGVGEAEAEVVPPPPSPGLPVGDPDRVV